MKVGRMWRAALAVLLLVLAVVSTPTQASAEEGDYLDVSITDISTPAIDVSQPDGILELTGTVTNTSTVPITWLEVDIWRMATPISTSDGLSMLTSNATRLPEEGRLVDETAGHRDVLRTTETFGPGESATFTVSASVADLGLLVDNSAYIVGVQARGLPADGPKRTLGRDHLVIPATQGAVESSAVVLLTAPPTWLPDGSFTDDSLADDLRGRLEGLLASAERPGVVAAIDPALLEATRRLTEPHLVAGEERPGNGVALAWLERVEALADDDRLWRLPYGNPSLTRAEASGMLHQVLAWAREALPDDQADLPSLAVIGDGASNDLIARVAEFDTVILRNAEGASPGPPVMVGAAPPGQAAQRSDEIRFARRIADELLAERAPLYLIDTIEAADADASFGEWRHHVPIHTSPSEFLTWGDAPAPAPWNEVTRVLQEGAANLRFLGELTGEEIPVDQAVVGSLAFSEGFTSEASAVGYVSAVTPPRVDTSTVTLRASQSFVMSSRTNTFPATITNGLDVPIEVRVEFRSESPQRITVPATDLVTVPAGESVTVDVTPRASSNGVTLVHAVVTTASGEAIAARQTIEITATDLGRVGWIIILVSGAVVVGGTALRIRAVRKQRAKEEE